MFLGNFDVECIMLEHLPPDRAECPLETGFVCDCTDCQWGEIVFRPSRECVI